MTPSKTRDRLTSPGKARHQVLESELGSRVVVGVGVEFGVGVGLGLRLGLEHFLGLGLA